MECFKSFKLLLEIREFEKEAIENGHDPDIPYFLLGTTDVDGNEVSVLSVHPLA
jgi:hypothetical protein